MAIFTFHIWPFSLLQRCSKLRVSTCSIFLVFTSNIRSKLCASPLLSSDSCQEVLLKGILQIVEANMDMEPLHFLTFPIILGASTPGGVSGSSRQNGAAGGKSVGLLWKGKLSPGRREGDGDYRLSHLHSSPWHTAPLHLPLVGQNCWPHMASGFSASMWLKVAEQEGKERDMDEGEAADPSRSASDA